MRSGAYPSSGKFGGVNDNPSVVSRTSDYFVTAFPNTTTVIVKHYRTHRESWPGGFSRNQREDAEALAANPLPSDRIELNDAAVNGHRVSYEGKMSVAFRTGADGRLIAFVGRDCRGITLDGVQYVLEKTFRSGGFCSRGRGFSGLPDLCFGTGADCAAGSGDGEKATVRLGKKTVPSETADGKLMLDVTPELSGRWLTVGK